MLTYQTPTTAPGGEERVDRNVRLVYKTVRYCSVGKEKEDGERDCVCVTERASCHSYVPSSKRRARLK